MIYLLLLLHLSEVLQLRVMLELALLIRRLARLHNHITHFSNLFTFCYSDRNLLNRMWSIKTQSRQQNAQAYLRFLMPYTCH